MVVNYWLIFIGSKSAPKLSVYTGVRHLNKAELKVRVGAATVVCLGWKFSPSIKPNPGVSVKIYKDVLT